MEINYNTMCIVSPRKDHLTFLRRKPSPSLKTYYIPMPIQVSRFKRQAKKTSRGRSFVVIYKFSYKQNSDLHSQYYRINMR